jgi:hypothetical protein
MTPRLIPLTCGIILAASAYANQVDTVPFSLIGSPTQQTLSLPQFDPALGTLTSATITLSGTIQFALEAFNTGAGSLSVTARDTLSFAGTPLLSIGQFSTTIPSNQPIFTFMPSPLPIGPLEQDFGPGALSFLIGTGTLPFNLSLASATVDQFTGPTTNSVLAFTGVTGNLTANYVFTPAVAPVPEPGTFPLAGLALLLAACLHRLLFRRKDAPTMDSVP